MELLSILNEKFQGKKTYATALVAILSAFAAYFSGDLTLLETLHLAVPALLAATVRHGIKTEGEQMMATAIISAEVASGKTIEEVAAEVEAAE